jgi:chromate transporter
MMRKEFVERRPWLSDGHFLDLIGITNLIPGPNSTEMAIHIGRERAGLPGLLVAGVCFILPAVFFTGFLAWMYQTYGSLPEVQPFLYGIKPAIIAVILSAVFPLGKQALKSLKLGILGLLAFGLCLLGYNEIYVMFGAGLLAALSHSWRKGKNAVWFLPAGAPWAWPWIAGTNVSLFLSFLKIGAVLYGSGYVLFAFLDAELVSAGLLTRQQLMDAIAVGQLTPGPVFSSVTFIGWQINGLSGAVAATIGVFLPSFVFVAVLNPLVGKLRQSRPFAVFLDGVNIASVAIILFVCVEMGRSVITGWQTAAIAAVSTTVTFAFPNVNTAMVVACSALLGYGLLLI